MSFVKLDTGILDSSLWVEDAEVRITFITMLAMCDALGFCAATAPGIARRANLPLDRVRAAMVKLEGPDAESRTLDDDGRRVRRVDGGYLIVNYLKYREKDHTAAARMRRYRERQRGTVTRNVTQAEAEVEAEVQKERDGGAPGGAAGSSFRWRPRPELRGLVEAAQLRAMARWLKALERHEASPRRVRYFRRRFPPAESLAE